jgi:hypothetical protein
MFTNGARRSHDVCVGKNGRQRTLTYVRPTISRTKRGLGMSASSMRPMQVAGLKEGSRREGRCGGLAHTLNYVESHMRQ